MAKKTKPAGKGKRALKLTKKKLRRANKSLRRALRRADRPSSNTNGQTEKRVRAALDELETTVAQVKSEVAHAFARR